MSKSDKTEINEQIAASIKNFSSRAKGDPTRQRQVIEMPEYIQQKAELISAHFLLPAGARIVDMGEAEAIELALELDADRLLIDERKGRRLASKEGIPVIGLLGVVLLSRRRNFIPSARILLDQIEREAGMYLDRSLKESALKAVDE